MKLYLVSLGAGLLVGIVYSLLGVRSPAPPIVALVGLAGILLGEQIIPLAKRLADRPELVRYFHQDCAPQILGTPPTAKERDA
ncbi:XapX domain-containing protein [Sphingopyxis sp. KK2]|uniref:XapX domain-containing protein n=1 Tax=Sphingopyxis sp. KK2 TaxID=1855727 RepID=UPI00097E5A7A|nr:XapX domain-containing protein [Sphingopyxis sp. KK2]